MLIDLYLLLLAFVISVNKAALFKYRYQTRCKMGKQDSTPKNQEAAEDASIKKSLPPWEIDTSVIQDPKEKKEAQAEINKWADQLSEDLHVLLTKNGIEVYELSFLHEGSRKPMLLYRGHEFMVCRLACFARDKLKAQVDEQLS
jgi:hypothetical protein